MGKRISIGTPSGAVVVLRQTNVRSEEAVETRTKSRLRRRRQRRRKTRKRYRSRHQMRRVAGGRTSLRRQRIFSPSPKISTDTAAAGGTCTGPSYRCDGSARWKEGQEQNTRYIERSGEEQSEKSRLEQYINIRSKRSDNIRSEKDECARS